MDDCKQIPELFNGTLFILSSWHWWNCNVSAGVLDDILCTTNNEAVIDIISRSNEVQRAIALHCNMVYLWYNSKKLYVVGMP